MDVHVGGRVRMRRMLLGMSQEQLGEQLGLTFPQVQKYEKGVNRIGASRLFEMAKVLGVPVQFFDDEAPFGATGLVPAVGFAERPSDSYVVDFLATREGLELNKAFALGMCDVAGNYSRYLEKKDELLAVGCSSGLFPGLATISRSEDSPAEGAIQVDGRPDNSG